MSDVSDQFPQWAQDLRRFLHVKPCLILQGNIQDRLPYPFAGEHGTQYRPVTMEDYLRLMLQAEGYGLVYAYDAIDGMRSLHGDDAGMTQFRERAGEGTQWPPRSLEQAMQSARRVLSGRTGATDPPIALIADFASRWVTQPDQVGENEQRPFLHLLKGMRDFRIRPDGPRNVLILLVDRVADLPVWFYLNSPFSKVLQVERPDREERTRFLETYQHQFPGLAALPEAEHQREQKAFIDLTDGMTVIDLESIKSLAGRMPGGNQMRQLVQEYKFGQRRSPWDGLTVQRLREVEGIIRQRVMGQDEAVTRTLDILKRAQLGLSGVQQSLHSQRPKGVLFFAGPTGVGKTELAKALSEGLFGDDGSFVRFDMTEYQAEHSDQRLLGAPPGYVGYEAGGQLTEAVRRRPFSVILFDEMEKAHDRLFDKFMQILDDGRLTDGRGETVYFSESVLIFTSNLGYTRVDADGRHHMIVDPQRQDTATIQKEVRTTIEAHFKERLGRPELLSRFGENFVVFDFIREPHLTQILRKMVGNLQQRLKKSHDIDLTLSDEVWDELRTRSEQYQDKGGRGIGNMLESVLINPLARELFEQDFRGLSIAVVALASADEAPAVTIRQSRKGGMHCER